VVGVTVSRPAPESVQRVGELAAGAATLLSANAHDGTEVTSGAVTVIDGFLGPAYGVASAAGTDAARLVAHTEGVFLDPAFGAKAMAALIGASSGVVDNDRAIGPVVFLVTGGAPTLFTVTGGRT
jgi:D-cysteine desulfhydrase